MTTTTPTSSLHAAAPFVADFHIHSHFSRATTPQLTPENLDYWSRLKGIHVMGTGDCIHPGWLAELKQRLQPTGNGLYRLRPEAQRPEVVTTRLADETLQFLLTTEISSIYKKAGRVRKVHTICVLPDFDAADRLQARLEAIGNIRSDGRPILGLDAKHLLEIVLECSPKAYVIPAHIWTPWFSLLGSQSGFDRLEECYDDLASEIFAVETGLSSDPLMNRACSTLDGVRLVSNSDAHSPEKLGREANLFTSTLSYDGIYRALKEDDGFLGTIEFFPQEGKYHYDGHRKCGVCWDPLETLKHRGVCSGCGKPVTRGVMYRVAQLADRPNPEQFLGKQRFWSITPLPELVAELLGQAGTGTQSVRREYLRLLGRLGSEFRILLWAELDELSRLGGERLAEGVRRLRSGEVSIEEGFDGEFGKIRVFRERMGRGSLFATGDAPVAKTHSVEFDIAEFQRRLREDGAVVVEPSDTPSERGLSDEQRSAIEFGEGVCVILAGPGSGKTRTLTERIAWLTGQRGVPPEQILALTFSNKAADEIRHRLDVRGVTIGTFHAIGLAILRDHPDAIGRTREFWIVDDEQRRELIATIAGDKRQAKALQRSLEEVKQGVQAHPTEELARALAAYDEALRAQDAVDLDDLVRLPVELLRREPSVLRAYRARWRWLLIDEYQDLNARQYEFVRGLAGDGNPNLFAIGDPDQAIYGFRGADVRLIQQLTADYPRAQEIRLSRSYRCPGVVLQGAGQVLQKDRVLAGTRERMKIHIQQCATDRSEADWIATRIEQMIGGVRSLSMHSGTSDGATEEGIASFRDFAVLCRASAMFERLAEALGNRGIAYQIVGTEPFYRQEPWLSAISTLRRAAQRGQAVEELASVRQSMQAGASVIEIVRRLLDGRELSELDQRRFARLATPFGADCAGFLRAIVMGQPVDDYDRDVERVSLMTMHASKGLEFQVVFIPGCEEGLIPFERFGKKSTAELAEEERLFYVAMTRTKRHLILSHANKRLYHGQILTPRRSPLLDRVERELLELAKQDLRQVAKDEYEQLSMWQ